jgi:apolipoprotein N-acyltransferase
VIQELDKLTIVNTVGYWANPDNSMHSRYQAHCNWCFAYAAAFISMTYWLHTSVDNIVFQILAYGLAGYFAVVVYAILLYGDIKQMGKILNEYREP